MLELDFDDDDDRHNGIPRHVMMDIQILTKLRVQFSNTSSPAFLHHAERHRNHMNHIINRCDQGILLDGYEYAVWSQWKDVPDCEWQQTW